MTGHAGSCEEVCAGLAKGADTSAGSASASQIGYCGQTDTPLHGGGGSWMGVGRDRAMDEGLLLGR